MYFFWTLWGINAIVALLLIGFFFVGLGDGSVSSFNIVFWLVILLGMGAVLLGGYWLFAHQYTVIAILLLSLVALPSLFYGLYMLLMIIGGSSNNWK